MGDERTGMRPRVHKRDPFAANLIFGSPMSPPLIEVNDSARQRSSSHDE
jgi:hypothetical protein